ncbi:hypothetical protein [Aliarcobacter cryaerophilus]|uniref:hypothetical protein n=1 Tax=Aliarcobacter cryaerophilus TaxID=28198 RepID=UPI001654749E|nr:hypothetical protein [Aliarcobacter cryaerophilus]QNM88696.1 hypothetical protein HOO41_03100 [Aliarcobacter cryaerophilus]
MKRNALYYQNINITESDWLMKRLLYWDKVYSIIPAEIIKNRNYLTPLMQELIEDKKLFEAIEPFRHYDQLENFRDKFLKEAIRYKDTDLLISKKTVKIHIEKMSGLNYELERLGTIKILNHPWYEMNEVLADILMEYLAAELCDKVYLEAVPITSGYCNTNFLNKEFIENEVLNFTMPLPKGEIKLEKIRKFRKRTKDIRQKFITRIDNITKRILDAETIEERKDLLNDERINFEQELQIINSEISRLWKLKSKHIILPLVITLGGALTGGFPGALIGLGTGLVNNLYNSMEIKEKNVLTYATDLQRI